MTDITALEIQLNSFEAEERRKALEQIASFFTNGSISLPDPKEEVNLHFHTFYSFNANSWSPSRIAWESRKYGLEAAGIVDFDVLDGMDEFLAAGELLGIKAVAGLESRVFISELADKVMSSPNEPGIAYFMAGGCFKKPPAGSDAERILLDMARTARERNLVLVGLVNDYLDQVQLDYDQDAMPLTPAGNVTERHLLTAYDNKAREVFGGDMAGVASFWADKLDMTLAEAIDLLSQPPKFHEKMRAKLMKFGGVGYVPPTSGSFPSIEDAITMMQGMEALPMATWLDGTNAGEENAVEWLGLLRSKGCVTMNIIPDRNWNIKDPDEKSLKTQKLKEVVEAARMFNMPICVGTEMNKAGLPFVDDFHAPELLPYVKDFVDGARCLYGHTVLAKYANFGYSSPAADAAFGDNIVAKNAFFSQVGSQFWSGEELKDPSTVIKITGRL